MKPIPVNELSGARGKGGDRRGQGGGRWAPGGAARRPPSLPPLPRPPSPRPPGPQCGEGRVTFRRRVRRLRSRFRRRRWEEPGGPRRRPRALFFARPPPPRSRPATPRARALRAAPRQVFPGFPRPQTQRPDLLLRLPPAASPPCVKGREQ